MMFGKVICLSLQKLWKIGSINLACAVPKFAQVWYIDFIKNAIE